MTALYSKITAILRAAHIETPERESRILWDAFGVDAEKYAQRRAQHEPMSHILGYRDFWKDRFFVDHTVLDPRPDSELFLDLALGLEKAPRNILDLGCGSGALGLSALREFPHAKLWLADFSQQALDIARKNAAALGLAKQCHFVISDWFENIVEKFDLILCNPPYIATNEMGMLPPELAYEPQMALTDGQDGLSVYRQIAPQLRHFLNPHGHAYFEHGAKQQEDIAKIFAPFGYTTKLHQDLSKNPRIVEVFL